MISHFYRVILTAGGPLAGGWMPRGGHQRNLCGPYRVVTLLWLEKTDGFYQFYL